MPCDSAAAIDIDNRCPISGTFGIIGSTASGINRGVF
jgi:hypothetical protein